MTGVRAASETCYKEELILPAGAQNWGHYSAAQQRRDAFLSLSFGTHTLSTIVQLHLHLPTCRQAAPASSRMHRCVSSQLLGG